MTRHASRRPDPASAPRPASPPAEAPVATGNNPVTSPGAPPRVFWGWRLALFIWATSFLFLTLLEFLSATFRVVGRWFRGG